jgi:hypothetical protein
MYKHLAGRIIQIANRNPRVSCRLVNIPETLFHTFSETMVTAGATPTWRPKHAVMPVSTEPSVRIFDPDLAASVSQAFIDAVMVLGRQVHKDRPPGMHYAYKHIKQTDLLHIAHGLNDKGNLGRMAFTIGSSPVLQGVKCIAPSTRGLDQALAHAHARADGTIVLSRKGKGKKIQVTQGGATHRIVEPTFDAGARRHDSEYLLLNYLGSMLQHYPDDIEGELILLTERIPCKYCFAVIQQFVAKYRRFRCNVVYFYETAGRDPASLIHPGLPANIRIYKGAMRLTGADLVRIRTNKPHHALSDRVLEHAESMDTSAHVSGRAIATAVIPLGRARRRSIRYGDQWRAWRSGYASIDYFMAEPE